MITHAFLNALSHIYEKDTVTLPIFSYINDTYDIKRGKIHPYLAIPATAVQVIREKKWHDTLPSPKDDPMSNSKLIFEEVQHPRQGVWVLMLCIVCIVWYSFIQQVIIGIPFGSQPAPSSFLSFLFVLFGLVLPIGVWHCKLVTQVRSDGIHIRLTPFHRRMRVFPYEIIQSYALIDYSPIAHFGGWGIRINHFGETSYSMRGNRGLFLNTTKGHYVIGTQHSEALEQSVKKALENTL